MGRATQNYPLPTPSIHFTSSVIYFAAYYNTIAKTPIAKMSLQSLILGDDLLLHYPYHLCYIISVLSFTPA